MSNITVLQKSGSEIVFRPFNEETMAAITPIDLTCAEAELFFLKEWSLERIEKAATYLRWFCYLCREYLDPTHEDQYLIPNVDTDEVYHTLQKTPRGRQIGRQLLGNLAWTHVETPKKMTEEERAQWENNRALTAALMKHHFGVEEYFDQLESSMRSRCGFTIAA
jgi:hypothetical protein